MYLIKIPVVWQRTKTKAGDIFLASDETRKSHQKEKEKIDRVKGKRGEEKKTAMDRALLSFMLFLKEKKLRSIFLEKDIF